MRKKKRKRTSGSRVGGLRSALALLLCGGLFAVSAAKERRTETFAVIAGTVFRDSGFSLPGAELLLDAAPGARPPAKFKRIKLFSDARGEFAVRVPPTPMRYTVSVRAAGYRSETKEVSVEGEERAEVNFRLERESK